jgi:hypothetical protein
MKDYSKWFMRISAIYALAGAMLGSDLAGREDYSLVAVHAHILVVGWLTLFVYGLFYYVVKDLSMKRTAKLHVWTGIIGGAAMPIGMLLYRKLEGTATLLTFIGSASVLLVAMIAFLCIVFFDKKLFAKN